MQLGVVIHKKLVFVEQVTVHIGDVVMNGVEHITEMVQYQFHQVHGNI